MTGRLSEKARAKNRDVLSVCAVRVVLAAVSLTMLSCEDSANLQNRARQMAFDAKELRESLKKLESERREMNENLERMLRDTRDLERQIQANSTPPEQTAARQYKADRNRIAIGELKAAIKEYRARYMND
jgi:TolA-binding protein